MPKLIVSLREPATPEAAERVAPFVQHQYGGDIERIRRRLLSPGVLARFDTPERAEGFAALLRDAGLMVEVAPEEEVGEFAWNADTHPPPPRAPVVVPAQSSVMDQEPVARSSGRAALIGAVVCLILGGLIAHYVPLLLIVFGPLFLAAFVLSIVGIAQGSTIAGILLLVISLVVGPAMSISGVARLLFPSFIEASDSSTAPAPLPQREASTSGEPEATVGPVASEEPPVTDLGDQEVDYSQFIVVYDFEATRINTFTQDNVAAVRFKVRNDGDKTVTRLRITAYFRDATDRVIFEEAFTVVSSLSFGSDTLRTMHPGYIFQMPSGRYFTAPRVPDEWDVGNAILQVSEIEVE